MNKYETIILINNNITEEQRNKIIHQIEEYIANNGKITKVDNIGTRKLAYEVKKQTEAYYYLIEFESEAKAVPELERIYRITEEILKFIVVKQD